MGSCRPAVDETDRERVPEAGNESTTAVCSTCSKTKRLSEMACDRTSKRGYRTQCRDCRKVYDQRRYQRSSSSILAVQRRYYQEHREFWWAKAHRRRAKQYGLRLVTELVTRQQLVERWGDCCVYCGGEFEVVDHRIPVAAGGHHNVLNVVPSCTACNQGKRWHSDEQAIRNFRNRLSLDGTPVTTAGVYLDEEAV